MSALEWLPPEGLSLYNYHEMWAETVTNADSLLTQLSLNFYLGHEKNFSWSWLDITLSWQIQNKYTIILIYWNYIKRKRNLWFGDSSTIFPNLI